MSYDQTEKQVIESLKLKVEELSLRAEKSDQRQMGLLVVTQTLNDEVEYLKNLISGDRSPPEHEVSEKAFSSTTELPQFDITAKFNGRQLTFNIVETSERINKIRAPIEQKEHLMRFVPNFFNLLGKDLPDEEISVTSEKAIVPYRLISSTGSETLPEPEKTYITSLLENNGVSIIVNKHERSYSAGSNSSDESGTKFVDGLNNNKGSTDPFVNSK